MSRCGPPPPHPFFKKLTNSSVRLPVTSSKTFRVWALLLFIENESLH